MADFAATAGKTDDMTHANAKIVPPSVLLTFALVPFSNSSQLKSSNGFTFFKSDIKNN